MQKWEYVTKSFFNSHRGNQRDYELSKLGDQGWELVSAAIVNYQRDERMSADDTWEEVFFFKRPK